MAFTMMELMFAIGIFAVGMSLVAGLFPAAIKETENTVKDYEGPIICENGLAIVKAKVFNIQLLLIARQFVFCQYTGFNKLFK